MDQSTPISPCPTAPADQLVQIDELTPEQSAAVTALAKRWHRANGPVISTLNKLGSKIEDQLALVPKALREKVEELTADALERAYGVAAHGKKLPDGKGRATLAAAMLSGAAGGAGGVATALAELPFTVTVLLHAIRREAEAQGYDPDDPWIMAEALRTFSSGSPVTADDGINTAFFSARMALTGPALQGVIASVAPKLATALTQKLAAQAIPVLGAVSGAAMNAAFLRYYREMAAIRFSLLRLSETYGAASVTAAFTEAIEQPRISRA